MLACIREKDGVNQSLKDLTLTKDNADTITIWGSSNKVVSINGRYVKKGGDPTLESLSKQVEELKLQLVDERQTKTSGKDNSKRLARVLADQDAIEFWSDQFGNALRVNADDFFMRFVLYDAI